MYLQFINRLIKRNVIAIELFLR